MNKLIILFCTVSFFSIEIFGQQNEDYQVELTQLAELDQKYRKGGELGSKQILIDSLNRIKLDSLFNLYGFPTEGAVSVEGQFSMWLVFQHSNDCEFNKKWFYRIVDEYEKGNVSDKIIDLINGSFHRFFIDDASKSRTREVGICFKLDPDDIKKYIQELIINFSTDTQNIFGIK